MHDEGTGACCPGKQCRGSLQLNRRGFLKTSAVVGVFGAGILGARAQAAGEELAQWTNSLRDLGERRVYRGEELEHIAFPLGGIGAGQVYLTGKGRLDSWQILNNFNTDAHAQGAHFAVWAKTGDGKTAARLLAQGSAEGAPGFEKVEFSGEYPLAWMEFPGGAGFPLNISLLAFCPMIPLNGKDSGLPAAVFRYRLENPGPAAVEASLLATAPNLIGWDGSGSLPRPEHPEFSGNKNVLELDRSSTHVHMTTTEGETHAFARPLTLVTNHWMTAFHLRLCANAVVKFDARLPVKDAAKEIYWCGDAEEGISLEILQPILNAVKQGASLVIAGRAGSLLASLTSEDDKTAELFEDWEEGYGDWTIEGELFRDQPATGAINHQQPVSGFRGKRLLNTFFPSDDSLGRATSKPFAIRKGFIHLLVGGGKWPSETCVSLLIDGQVIHSATGENTERLRPVVWDVRQHAGKEARIEIVDQRTGGWGHVLVDDIFFSESPVAQRLDPEVRELLREVFPFRCKSADYVTETVPAGAPESLHPALKAINVPGRWVFEDLKVQKGSGVLLQTADGQPLVISGQVGSGHITVCCGAPEQWAAGFDTKTIMGSIIEKTTGNVYTPQTGWHGGSPLFGTMALSVLGADAEGCQQWDDFAALWEDFAADGRVVAQGNTASAPGRTWNAALHVPLRLGAGESQEVIFLLTWHFPNRTRSQHYGWGPGPLEYDHRLGNQYNNHFKNALEVAQYVARELPRLEQETKLFHETFYATTLPRYFLDCISANTAITRSPVYVWLEDGTVGGFEGTDSCCPMNCTHVYNYAMTMPYLFPALERNVRETDLLHQMHPDEHFIPHRTVLPLSLPRLGNLIGGPHHHALDGELSTLLKLYREWRQCGDREWLKKLWPNAKLLMEHVLRDHDTGGDGVLKDLQANTYDTHLYGSNTFIGTMYLAALRATEEMARLMDDTKFADTCRQRFESGSKGYDATCWNGEYYYNVYDSNEKDPNIYEQNNCYGPGCFSDQVLGQWWAHLMGLGHLLPRERVQQALRAVHKYNWRPDLSEHSHSQRVFAEGSEKGLLVGSWPNGGRPKNPILYCDEVWTGIEYHVAATLIYEGMVEEALQIIRGARDRYTGARRNPWSEIECGGHYARAMSSYSLLLAAAGLEYDAGQGLLGVDPKLFREDFRCFFATDSGWGDIRYQEKASRCSLVVAIRHGRVQLRRLALPARAAHAAPREVEIKGAKQFQAEEHNGRHYLVLADDVTLNAGEELRAEYPV